MKSPIFSFVIPVFSKPPEVFRKCLASLFDMSMKDVEVICVFDGPNEILQNVCREFHKINVDVPRKQIAQLSNEIVQMRKSGMAKRATDMSLLSSGWNESVAKIASTESISEIENELSKLYSRLCETGEDYKTSLHSLWQYFVPSSPSRLQQAIAGDMVVSSSPSRTSLQPIKQFVIDHGGAPKARNYGLDRAQGKYVWFWDADCFIKPDHAKRMLEEFEAVPDADFVYSGYEMAEGQGEFASEPFDAYSLQSGNYISSMAPILRSKAPRWDESLEAAQDWDYWLTCVEQGLKGVYVEGSGFITDTYRTGLSSVKWSAENRENTIYTVRHKHGIPDREIGVYSLNYRAMGIKLAQILGADVIKPTGPSPTVYKVIVNLGYSFMSRFEGIGSDVSKIQYWLPGEIEALGSPDAKHKTVMETIRIAKTVTNYCGTPYEKNRLDEIGIQAEVLLLPLAKEDVSKISQSLPEKFTILVASDKAYSDLLKDLSVDLPHIKFIQNAGKVADFSCFLSFYQFAALDTAMLTAHVNGRHVISNVQAPYCGFVDPDQTWDHFKRDLYEKIREVKDKPFNKEAQDYYLVEADPEKFYTAVHALEMQEEMA